MENYNLENDIKVFYVTAKSFPDGIMEAFETLRSKLSSVEGRRLFGISHSDKNGKIIYKAAAEELDKGEAEKLNCETFIIKKGTYISVEIKNFMTNIAAIRNTFRELLSHPDIDPQGACIEWYLNERDVRCMVRLKQTQ